MNRSAGTAGFHNGGKYLLKIRRFIKTQQIFELSGMLGSEYCAGYLDSLGEWTTGFYCPSIAASLDVFCCGSLHTKYCCDRKDQVVREEVEG